MNKRSQEKVEKKKMSMSFQVLTRANYFNEVMYMCTQIILLRPSGIQTAILKFLLVFLKVYI